MNPLIQLRKATPVFLVALACFGLSPMVQALLPPPPPDGGYLNENTAEGDFALFNVTTGSDNTAIGFQALFRNTTGGSNTATGFGALFRNTTGRFNTASGAFTLNSNITGSENTATGVQALRSNTRGSDNTANGYLALFDNITGNNNTATGVQALLRNTTGSGNTATGVLGLFQNTTGNNNTATGIQALRLNTIGSDNTAIGFQALFSNTTGNRNIAFGFNAGTNLTTGDNNIDIGNVGVAGESATIRIGMVGTQTTTFIAGIFGSTISNGAQVIIGAGGRIGTIQSSVRFKEAIKPMDKASEAILALQPVTFHYKKEFDPEGIPQFGLIAEQVEKVNPDLVVRDENGDVSSVRYEAVNAMLLNEFLKEHRRNEEQAAMIAQQQKQIEALAAGLQKVSAQLELNKPAPQVAENNQ